MVFVQKIWNECIYIHLPLMYVMASIMRRKWEEPRKTQFRTSEEKQNKDEDLNEYKCFIWPIPSNSFLGDRGNRDILEIPPSNSIDQNQNQVAP